MNTKKGWKSRKKPALNSVKRISPKVGKKKWKEFLSNKSEILLAKLTTLLPLDQYLTKPSAVIFSQLNSIPSKKFPKSFWVIPFLLKTLKKLYLWLDTQFKMLEMATFWKILIRPKQLVLFDVFWQSWSERWEFFQGKKLKKCVKKSVQFFLSLANLSNNRLIWKKMDGNLPRSKILFQKKLWLRLLKQLSVRSKARVSSRMKSILQFFICSVGVITHNYCKSVEFFLW